MAFEWWLDGETSRDLPTLAHPPAGARWWCGERGELAFSTRSDTWFGVGERWLRTPRPATSLWHTGDAWRVSWGAEDTWTVDATGAHLVPCVRPDRPDRLPAAVHAAAGDGIVWSADGFVYRSVGGRIDCLGTSGAVTVGPEGGVLVGDSDHWSRFAPPGRPPRPLSPPMAREPWGVRWSTRGDTVAGLDLGGSPRQWDGRSTTRLETLPLDTTGSYLDGGEVIGPAGRPLRQHMVSTSTGRSGPLLAGPAHALWDLRSGQRLRTIVPGAIRTVGIPGGRFLAIDSAQVRWFDEEADQSPHAVALPDDVADAWSDGEGVIIECIDGSRLTVRGDTIEAGGAPRSTPPHRPSGVAIRTRYFGVDGVRRAGLRVRGAARVDGGVWAWTREGMLLRIPSAD